MTELQIDMSTPEGQAEYERILIEKEGLIRCAHCKRLIEPDDNYCRYCRTPNVAKPMKTGLS